MLGIERGWGGRSSSPAREVERGNVSWKMFRRKREEHGWKVMKVECFWRENEQIGSRSNEKGIGFG